MRMAIIGNDGITVENVIIAEPDFKLPNKTIIAADNNAEPGGTYVGGVFFKKEREPVVDQLSETQNLKNEIDSLKTRINTLERIIVPR